MDPTPDSFSGTHDTIVKTHPRSYTEGGDDNSKEESHQQHHHSSSLASCTPQSNVDNAHQQIITNLAATAWVGDSPPFSSSSSPGLGGNLQAFTPSDRSAFLELSPRKKTKTYKRSTKVAKASYSDHGTHANRKTRTPKKHQHHNSTEDKIKMLQTSVADPILKCLTFSIRQTYSKIAYRDGHHTSSVQSGVKDSEKIPQNNEETDSKKKRGCSLNSNSKSKQVPILLKSPSPSFSDAPPETIATPEEYPTTSCIKSPSQIEPSGLHISLNSAPKNKLNTDKTPPVKKICLTIPSSPISNKNLDNCEGNLIVHTHDIISIPTETITLHPTSNMSSSKQNFSIPEVKSTKFLVMELLGQGTFAQVFKCQNLETKQLVAVKIIKNKPAYARQAAIEIDIFRVLSSSPSSQTDKHARKDNMVLLESYFVYESHLCLVFELLGLNLYEVLKRRQFRGLPIRVVQALVRQSVDAMKDLSLRSVVHCDLKPENILLVNDEVIQSIVNAGDVSGSGEEEEGEYPKSTHPQKKNSCTPSPTRRPVSTTPSLPPSQQRIKLIDFGSACFEGQTAHTYIQSRFYRSPEVLVGLPYDSAIDMWSLGCVAAELFLGLPILPGVHEYDQLGRISEMIGKVPDWMIEQGSKSNKYFVKVSSSRTRMNTTANHNDTRSLTMEERKSTPPARSSAWCLKTWQEYISSLSSEERANRAGLAKLDQQPTNRYFKRKKLADIIMLHGHYCPQKDRKMLRLFVHFLKGVLDPDPWKRWTAHQASMHPFITNSTTATTLTHQKDEIHHSIREKDVYWVPPWDPSICRRKLLNVEKAREKQRRNSNSGGYSVLSGGMNMNMNTSHQSYLQNNDVSAQGGHNQEGHLGSSLTRGKPVSPEMPTASRVTAMTDAMSLSQTCTSHSQSTAIPGYIDSFEEGGPSPPASIPLPNNPRYHARNKSNDVMKPSQSHHNMHLSDHMLSGSLGSAVGAMYHRSAYDVDAFSHSALPSNINRTESATNLQAVTKNHSSRWESQYPTAAAFVISPSMHSMNSGYDYSFPTGATMQHLPPLMATVPQSFSGVYYDGASRHHLPIETDLAYALQRPGVVPSMEGQHGVIPPRQCPPPPPPLSFAHLHHQTHNSSVLSHSLNDYNRSAGMVSAASLRHQSLLHHRPDHMTNSNTYHADNDGIHIPLTNDERVENTDRHSIINNPSQPRVTSLLAQQLAEHSASSHSHVNVNAPPQHNHNPYQNTTSHEPPPNYPHAAAAAHPSPSTHSHSMNMYNTGHVGSYGSLSHHVGGYYSFSSPPGQHPPMILPQSHNSLLHFSNVPSPANPHSRGHYYPSPNTSSNHNGSYRGPSSGSFHSYAPLSYNNYALQRVQGGNTAAAPANTLPTGSSYNTLPTGSPYGSATMDENNNNTGSVPNGNPNSMQYNSSRKGGHPPPSNFRGMSM